jgi:hypothetical protein
MGGEWSSPIAQRVTADATVCVVGLGTRSALSVGSPATLQENANSVAAPVMAAGGAQVPATDPALLTAAGTSLLY